MKFGMVFAGDSEVAPFLEQVHVTKKSGRAMLTFYEGTVGDREFVTLYTGVGKTNAAVAAQVLIDHFGVDCMINGGTCGGIREEVEVFDTIVAEGCFYHDLEETILTEFQPWLKTPCFPADRKMLETARRLQPQTPLHFGLLVTGDRFLENQKQREEVLKRFPAALGADMESAAFAHVCYVNRVPFLSVRTVTDNGKQSGEAAFEENVEKASAISAGLCLELIGSL